MDPLDLASSGQLDPLRDALESAFSDSDESLRAPSDVPPASEVAAAPAPEPISFQQADTPPDDSWRTEYDQRLATWRAEAAEARQKAEEERARWAAIRETERAQERRREEERLEAIRRSRSRSGSDQGWEDVEGSEGAVVSEGAAESSQRSTDRSEAETRTRLASARAAAQVAPEPRGRNDEDESVPSVSDARDLTTSEMEAAGNPMFESDLPSFVSVPSQGSTPPTIPSMIPTDTDSLVEVSGEDKSSPDADESSPNEARPSLREKSAMRRRAGPSRTPAGLAKPETSREEATPEKSMPKSLVLSVFSPDLPWSTRILALVSTVAINLALPFVNGVMLGFGEIFARNYIAVWIGWTRRPKGTATAVGVRY